MTQESYKKILSLIDEGKTTKEISEETTTEKVVLPPYIVKKYESLEFSDPTIPGEIKVDTQGRLLNEWFRLEGPFGSRDGILPLHVVNGIPNGF